jgi:phage portal protein BeeE
VSTIVWDVSTALRIPSVSRATALIAGMIRQCAMDAYRGTAPLGRPRLLDRPDPTRSRSWFVGTQVEDYLWHGNALSVITSRNAEGWPATVAWVPAATAAMAVTPDGQVHYWSGDRELPADSIVHVRRSADRWRPWRGVGVIEQHLGTLDRVAMEEEYERSSLSGSGVPSVAIVAPNPALSQAEADAGKITWMEKYGGPVREPAILPFGTTVTPLGWSPSDSQMVEARKMSLVDVANAFNLDGYWLGAEMRGLTYRSPGPLFLALVRTTEEPILADFEQEWADGWLPRGQEIRFDRLQMTRDDFASSIDALAKAIAPPQSDPTVPAVLSTAEARVYLGLPPEPDQVTVTSPVATEVNP